MNSKEFLTEFLTTIVGIALLIGAGYFLITGGLEQMKMIMQMLAPLGVLFAVLLYKFFKGKRKIRREGNNSFTLYLNYWDKIKADFVVYGVPFILLLLPVFLEKELGKTDFFQAAAAYIVIYLWKRSLFKKA